MIVLPPAIDTYFKSENERDVDALGACFHRDGTVRDEGKIIAGVDEIKAWRQRNAAKYQHRTEPLQVDRHDSRVVVVAEVAGNFPGSPVRLEHVFELRGDRIAALEIH